MGKNIIAIIQARMGSKRFPGKVLADLAGNPMLWHVINRAQQAKTAHLIVVATSLDAEDDAIADFCVQNGVVCFRGNSADVLDRYYQSAKEYGADTIVRLTADCPLLDPQVIDKVVQTYLQGDFDYVSNILKYTYPDGLDTEVFSFAALEKAWQEAKSLSEREHVTPFIRKSGLFRLHNVASDIDAEMAKYRWTVDDPRDLEFVRAIYAKLKPAEWTCDWKKILQILAKEPHLVEINSETTRNEGYFKTLAQEPPVAPQKRNLERSMQLKEEAKELIPSLSQTFSKGPTQFVQGVAPAFLERGEGCHVWDVDGNEYIDYAMALGPVILGYNNLAVTEAVVEQAKKGASFSLPHPLEIEVAKALTELISIAEMVRFGKNGSDITSAAVRLARAHTGRELITCCGYHGWQDWYIGTTTRNLGVPKAVASLTVPFKYNDIASLEAIFKQYPDQVACVMMEPVGLQAPKEQFLQKVAHLAKQHGALLVFDEVLTGFRFALGGAQEYFDVKPDLTCVGKAIANGYPLSAIVGPKNLMLLFDQIFFSFTFGGEAVSLAAAKATLKELREKNVVSYLWTQGQRLKDGFNILAKEFGVHARVECVGFPPRTSIQFKESSEQESLICKSLFQQECIKRGILFSGSHNMSFSHSSADIDYTLKVYRTALEILANAIKEGDVLNQLEGDPVQPVFRKTS